MWISVIQYEFLFSANCMQCTPSWMQDKEGRRVNVSLLYDILNFTLSNTNQKGNSEVL